jgi:hypothetical protein
MAVHFSMMSCYLKNLLLLFSNLKHNSSGAMRSNIAHQMYPNSNRLDNLNMVLLDQHSSINRPDMDGQPALLQQAYSMSITLKPLCSSLLSNSSQNVQVCSKLQVLLTKPKGAINLPSTCQWKSSSREEDSQVLRHNRLSPINHLVNRRLHRELLRCPHLPHLRLQACGRHQSVLQLQAPHRPEDQEPQVVEQVCRLLSQVVLVDLAVL